ncbi:DUF3040 domain-containing protein [Sphaerimonospora cavernae]|uniref:DUF3040 domain-containing protein n=1 Tax=Sphaerimonospora cavernae TaxID=1740611 RepID=A0ABV6U7U7_9ACTN
MAWSQDEERMLTMIERHLTDEDPKLAARIESFNQRVERKEHGRRRTADRAAGGARGRWPRRSTLIITLSWMLIVVLITALLIMALQHNAAALPI